MNLNIRTDLAIETRELYRSAQKLDDEIPGIETLVDSNDEDYTITTVKILSDEGANALNKAKGDYVTIESKYMNDEVKSIDEKLISKIAESIKDMTTLNENSSILVIGLGNSDVTPDALGPKVVDNISITRHLINYAPDLVPHGSRAVSAVVPGVLGTTGIETADIIKGIVKEVNPNLIILIDALAAKDMKRIGRTIQITNTGIAPGSGVKNNRNEITEKVLGVPVIAVGIPTVVGVPTIINDATTYLFGKFPLLKSEMNAENYMQNILNNEDYDFMVTPNDIDDIITNLSSLLAEGINKALSI